MNTAAPSTPEIARVRELMPWYARGALDADDHAFVQDWLLQHTPLPAELAAELEWLCSTELLLRQAVREQAAEPARLRLAAAGQARLLAQLRREPLAGPPARPRLAVTAALAPASPLAALQRWLADTLAPRAPTLALGVAAVLAIQAAVFVTLLPERAGQGGEQSPLSGETGLPPLADQVLLTVAFKPQASEQAVRELLARVGGQIVAGPTALGLYRLAVPRARAAAALAALKADREVVESAQAAP